MGSDPVQIGLAAMAGAVLGSMAREAGANDSSATDVLHLSEHTEHLEMAEAVPVDGDPFDAVDAIEIADDDAHTEDGDYSGISDAVEADGEDGELVEAADVDDDVAEAVDVEDCTYLSDQQDWEMDDADTGELGFDDGFAYGGDESID